MHNHHESAPNFSEQQILHDGCQECETRSKRNDHGLSTLDSTTFRRAWTRAARYQKHGLPDIAQAEIPLLEMLISVQIRLERIGLPLGTLPTAVSDTSTDPTPANAANRP